MTEVYHLGDYAPIVSAMAARLDAGNVPARLREGDYTLWSENPAEIDNRLGWLTLPADVRPQVAELEQFAGAVRAEGYRHIVLLGMGGSVFGPEVIRQIIAPAGAGYPQMLTLDSTVPGRVAAIAAAIDPARTIFVVSSKSGTTTEPLAFYSYFRDLVDAGPGPQPGGRNFVAITDPGTPLAALAESEHFRRAFINDPNIGGRYSVLSCFGLVPAALAGVNLESLLDAAAQMQRRCAPADAAAGNPGAWLGAAAGALAKGGRDKLTLIASDGIAGFGLWVEQMLAESLGKDGAGIIPVAGEPLQDPESYGDDRFFVQLRLATDDNGATDRAVRQFRAAGHPVAILELSDAYDLGAEFYRWEYATAIMGHIMGIHPFDQPDVQGAKDRTVNVLDYCQRNGCLPPTAPGDAGHIRELLGATQPGDYLAIMAYLPESAAVNDALHTLRRRVMRQRHIATTAGYGPRMLHSTGQLHKGGPDSGVFLQLTHEYTDDVAIPGWPFSFGVLADAQALGDLQALQALGRRALSVRLQGNPADAIRSLTDGL